MKNYRNANHVHPMTPWVISGRVRRRVLLRLLKSPAIPSFIATQLRLHRESVSRSLRCLERKKLVKCTTKTASRVHFYALTVLGREVANNISELGYAGF